MRNDDFGDRMKLLESAETGRRCMPLLPICARLDGKNFSNFTRGMERPYDKRLSDLMISTTEYLVRETNANMGYTQSDEISLTWLSTSYDSQVFFDGKIQKMTSVLASMCTAYFNWRLPGFFSEGKQVWSQPTMAMFDCRVWNVPNIVEGANVFLWREKDATKNSITMAASHYYSHKELHLKDSKEKQELLWQKGVNWNDYPEFFKRGSFVRRTKRLRRFSEEEIVDLPPLHEARRNPALMIERTDYEVIQMPSFSKVVNRPQVIYEGADPVILHEEK